MSNTRRLALLAPLLLTATVFGRTLQFEFVDFDDDILVTHNPYVVADRFRDALAVWRQPHRQLYIPLSYTAWAAISRMARADPLRSRGHRFRPAPFHAANLALHLVSVALVYAILLRLFGAPWAAAVGATLFGIHPVQAEPVCWVTGLKDVLGGTLSLAAVLVYVSAVQCSSGRGSRLRLLSASVLFAAALTAKPNTVALPLLVFVLDAALLGRSARHACQRLLPWFALAVVWCVITVRVQPPSGRQLSPRFGQRLLVAGDALNFYIGKCLAPLKLSPDYGRTPERVLRSRTVWWTWLGPLLVLAATRRRQPAWLRCGVLIFVAALLPVSGLVTFRFQVFSTVADRYLYLALLGAAVTVAGWWAHGCQQRWRVAVLLWLGFLAWTADRQTEVWRDSQHLWNHVLEVNPRSWAACNNLGLREWQRGNVEAALRWFRRSVELRPEHAEAHNNLGLALRASGDLPGAVSAWRRAVELKPELVEGRVNLGDGLRALGQTRAAIDCFRAALRLDPGSAAAHYRLGVALMESGQLAEARRHLETALRLRPDAADVRAALERLEEKR